MSIDVRNDESLTDAPSIAPCATCLILLHTLQSSDKSDLRFYQSKHDKPAQTIGNALLPGGVEHHNSIPSLVSMNDERDQKSRVDNCL